MNITTKLKMNSGKEIYQLGSRVWQSDKEMELIDNMNKNLRTGPDPGNFNF